MLSIHSALIHTMVLVSASDSNMSDKELQTIGNITRTLPVFAGFDMGQLPEIAAACADILSEKDGFETELKLIATSLPAELRETAYALALEIAATDKRASQEELRLLELLRHELGIDRLIAAGIERGARARHAVAKG